MDLRKAWYDGWPVMKEGPGRGWWAPPKGTHGTGDEPEGERREGKAPIGKDTTTKRAEEFLAHGIDKTDLEYAGKVKASIVSRLSNDSGVPEEEVNLFIRQWAETSNDADMRSLSIQTDAADAFGTKVSEFTKGRIAESGQSLKRRLLPNAPEFHPLLESEKQQAILKAMHNYTQEELLKAGFEKGGYIRLRRGSVLSRDQVKGWKVGDVVPTTGNPLESWSVSGIKARDFARGVTAELEGRAGIVFEMDVPLQSVIGTARTGFGSLGEEEFVILGSAGGKAKVLEIHHD